MTKDTWNIAEKYVGYWNFGAINKKQAKDKYGFQVEHIEKPNILKQLLARICSIYWIDYPS